MANENSGFAVWNASSDMDKNERYDRLKTACLYLREYEPPALDFFLADEMDRVIRLFESPLESADSEATRAAQEREWRNVRRFLRLIDGRVSDQAVFLSYAREEFESEWSRQNLRERRASVERRLLENNSRVKTNRLKNYALNIATVTSENTDPESIRGRIVDVIVFDKEAAFALSEYATALDDYGFSDSEETRILCDAMIDFLRDRFISNLSTPESVGQETESSPENDEPVAAAPIDQPDDDPEGADDTEESDDFQDSDAQRGLRGADGYYPVNEELAKAAQEANSFRDYALGSATREYRTAVDSAREVAARQKEKVDARYHEKIDRILDAYERQLAAWYDRFHRNAASCPSIMIAGAGNFPRQKHEKKIRRTSELLREHEKIKENMERRIKGVGTAGISSDDSDALERLETKLAVLKERHEEMKKANAYRRKNGSWEGYEGPLKNNVCNEGPAIYQFFNLPNSLAEIHRIDQRIKYLKRQTETEYGDGWNFDGGVVKANKDENRLQIFFDDVPPEKTRADLRHCGFRWSPRNKAWQRMLTPDAIFAAKRLGFIPSDWKAGDAAK